MSQTYPEIRTLGPDQLITEPGFYDIPIERHHNQPCDGFSVTSSSLRKALLFSPAEFWAHHPLNPHAELRPDTPALRMGRAMAALVEGGVSNMEAMFNVLPDDAPSRPTKTQVAAFERNGFWSEAAEPKASFWEAIDSDPRTPLKNDEFQLIVKMAQALANNPVAQAALSGNPEVTMAWRDPVTGIWLLSRPDQFSFSGQISDYKKVSLQGRPMTPSALNHKIDANGYDQQMALAAEGFHFLTGEWPTSVGLVFQSDQPPYSVYPIGIHDQYLKAAQLLNRKAIDLISSGWTTGRWMEPAELQEQVYGEQPEYHPSYSKNALIERLNGA